MMRAIQYIKTATCAADASTTLDWLRGLDTFIDGRVLPPSAEKPGFRVQVFFEDCGSDAPLPDGCRRVFLPPSLLEAM